jgi:hypothetical protein
MDAQNVFYSVGIVFMIFAILILLGIAVLVFYIRKKAEEIQKFIEIRINELTAISLKPIQKTASIAKSLLPQTKKSTK